MTATNTTTPTPVYSSDLGRPLMLPEIEATLLAHLESGMMLKDAAEASGIAYRTMRRWVEIGETELERIEQTPKARIQKKLKIYVDFALKYRQSMAKRRRTLLDTATLVAIGHYELREVKTTTIEKNGVVVEQIKQEKTTEVGPDGGLALKLLQYQDTQKGEDKKPEAPADGQWSLDDWLREVEQRRASAAATAALFEEVEDVPPG